MIFKTPIQYLLILILVVVSFMGCRKRKEPNATLVKQADWRYFGEANPGNTAQLFLPGIISTRYDERDFTVTRAGNEIFYSMVLPGKSISCLVYLYHDGAFWSDKLVPGFSGRYADLEPTFSPNGNQLFFVSKRPIFKENKTKDWNIWFVEKQNGLWSKAKALDSIINSPKDEYYPSVANNGNIYFTAQRDDSFGGEDIYMSRNVNGSYSKPVNLGSGVNTVHPEFNAFIAPDERYLIFSSANRADDLGGGDLYISYRENDSTWSQATNLGKGINSEALDYCPFVTADGHYLFFTSERADPAILNRNPKSMHEIMALTDGIENGLGNIFWVEFNHQ